MNVYVIDAVLLLTFSVPIMFTYHLSPYNEAYWLYGLVFLLFAINIITSIFIHEKDRKKGFYIRKMILTWVIIGIVLGGALMTSIIGRGKNAPGGALGVHDIVIQNEQALSKLLAGKNPYKETYFDTQLEEWEYRELGVSAINPALYHYVMPPWYLISGVPIRYISYRLFGFFDSRWLNVIGILGVLIVISYWLKRKEIIPLSLILVSLNPGTVQYLIEGRSDIYPLFWLVLSLFLLDRKYLIWSGISFVLAMLSKQSIWISTPLYIFLVYFSVHTRIKKLTVPIAVSMMVAVVILLPFLLWDARAFFDSTVFYLSGNTEHGYPVAGYGIGMLFYSLGIIKDIHDAFPFGIFQLVVALTGYWIFFRKLKQHAFSWVFFIGYGCTLFGVWYVSRYFNNSHVGFISLVFLIGMIKLWDEKGLTIDMSV